MNEINSILQIREKRDQLKDLLKSVDRNAYEGETFGPENEYTFKGVLGGIEAVITDISTLTKAHSKYLKTSNFSEREQLRQYLEAMIVHFENIPVLVETLDSLKTFVRRYNIRNTAERQLEFEKEIEETLKRRIQLEDELKEIRATADAYKELVDRSKTELNSLNDLKLKTQESIDQLEAARENLLEESESLKSVNVTLTELLGEGQEKKEEIGETLNRAKASEKLISSFSNNVQERENRLTKVSTGIDEIDNKLKKYEQERERILKEARNLINSAKDALKYKTAEGISAAFQGQYEDSGKLIKLLPWLIAAGIFVLGAVGIGIWIFVHKPDDVGLLIGRIALTSLPIAAAIFCARQYVKQKNIIEDYAYKMVVAKAMVGFSEELLKNSDQYNDEYAKYVQKALNEIHRDPMRMRKRDKFDIQFIGFENDLKEVKDSLAEISEKVLKNV